MSKNMAVTIAGVAFKNPVMTASGTFGHGEEFEDFVDLNKLGGVIVKGVSMSPWAGNPVPRIAETHGGMLNSIGLQNPGVEAFIETGIPYLRKFNTNIVVNICGHTLEEYVDVTKTLAAADVDMLELNISCPNVSAGGITFGTDRDMAAKVVSKVKKRAKQPLIVKLSPNVTDIVSIAKAVEDAGADGISLINTLLGMQIDIHNRKFALANKVGGLSGPAIKPVAVRMVYLVAHAVSVPVIGMGGVSTGEDAIEFMMAGATGVAVGTANFANPHASEDVVSGMEAYMEKHGLENINEIIKII